MRPWRGASNASHRFHDACPNSIQQEVAALEPAALASSPALAVTNDQLNI